MTKPEPESPPYAKQLLAFLNLMNKPMYMGTANRGKVRRRRAKNRVAKRSRKVNRT